MALAIIGIALTLTTFAALNTSTTLPSTGTVTTSANLGVYSNSGCTTSLSSIPWGTLTPGGTATYTIYVKNTSSALSLTLNMTTPATSWSPTSANGPITITWNQQGTDLQPGASTTATLTLTVSSSIVDVTSFSVNICIGGTNP